MYAPKSQAAVAAIKENVDVLFRARKEEAYNLYNHGMTKEECENYLINSVIPADIVTVFEKHKHLFQKISRIKVRFVYPNGYNETMSFEIAPRHLPGTYENTYSNPVISLTEGPLFEMMRRRNEAIKLINDECRNFHEKVEGLLESVPSLNAFVKLWPPGRELLTTEMKAKIDAPTPPRATKENLGIKEEDLSSLSVHLIKAKVAR